MGLYIHVPFCGSICSYCHFARTADHGPERRARYVETVLQEFELRRRSCEILSSPKRRLETCYLGGGTPSELEPELMSRLLAGTVGRLATAPDFELTAEANPESLTDAKAHAWRDLGIDRISLGVQSLDPGVLKLLGRACDPATARRGLERACRIFPRVSADWIIGPGLDSETLLAELTEAADLGVEHFSVYILEVHPGTRLAALAEQGAWSPAPDSETEQLYLAVAAHLADLGIPQYEVANFARAGAESRHNRNYWTRKPWLGLGPGAHGFWGRRRYANHDNIQDWQKAVEEGRLPEAEVDPLDGSARRLERLILALRTLRGVPLEWLPGSGWDTEQGIREGLWEVNQGRLILTGKGFLRIDSIEERLAGLTP
ncbi:MAG: radical SAM family heme chaperone HemW [Acidobacteria bacterium]|uniref:Heme chaperone HemW n=1 Tax=Candidatus Polarisedimenticola svalbardensis TaxID=2886004 RepID=A0A8J7CE26_9BACT|nr:radical SAM family heme chaperone HemW [Candidatus Polarisedimenticola svalbardensis]